MVVPATRGEEAGVSVRVRGQQKLDGDCWSSLAAVCPTRFGFCERQCLKTQGEQYLRAGAQSSPDFPHTYRKWSSYTLCVQQMPKQCTLPQHWPWPSILFDTGAAEGPKRIHLVSGPRNLSSSLHFSSASTGGSGVQDHRPSLRVGSVLKWSRAPLRDPVGTSPRISSQGGALAEVARCRKQRHRVTEVFLLPQSWSAVGRPFLLWPPPQSNQGDGDGGGEDDGGWPSRTTELVPQPGFWNLLLSPPL